MFLTVQSTCSQMCSLTPKKEIAYFVGCTHRQGGVVCPAVLNLKEPNKFPLPPDPPDNATQGQRLLWEKLIGEVVTLVVMMQNETAK
jgi:hypothetical protein